MYSSQVFAATLVLFAAGIAIGGEKLPTLESLQSELQSLRKKVEQHKGIVIAEVETRKFEQAIASSNLISSADLIRTTTFMVIRIKQVLSGPMSHVSDKEYSQTISVKTRHKDAPLIPDNSKEKAKPQKLKYQLTIVDGQLIYKFEVIKQDTPNQ